MASAGDRIRKLRELAGLSQGEFAAALGVNRAGTVSRWEGDLASPQLRQLRALAAATASTVEAVRSWLDTGKPELVWKVGGPEQPAAAAPQAGTGQDPTGTDEVERAIAYWFWRYELTEAERGEAIRRFRVAVTRSAPGRPKGWDETTGRSGGS